MKKSILFTNAIIFWAAFSIVKNTVTVSQGTSPKINGIILPGEWNDATIKTCQAFHLILSLLLFIYFK